MEQRFNPCPSKARGCFPQLGQEGTNHCFGSFFLRCDFFLSRFLLDLRFLLYAAWCLQQDADAQPAATRVSAFTFSLGLQVPFRIGPQLRDAPCCRKLQALTLAVPFIGKLDSKTCTMKLRGTVHRLTAQFRHYSAFLSLKSEGRNELGGGCENCVFLYNINIPLT